MQGTSKAVLDAAMQLPEEERMEVVSRLLETLPHDVDVWSSDDPDFINELDRRFADPAGSISWTELRDEA